MKKINTIIFILVFTTISYAQVGINTETPEATLDVNGNLRVRKSEEIKNAEYVLSANKEGFIRQLSVQDLSLGAVDMESATFIPGANSITSRTPILDLWQEQEDNGVESIKRYYFLGQNVSITLPKNISSLGDKTARVLTFVIVKNNEFGGQPISNWNVAFQTKLYQENTNDFNQSNGGVFLYENTFADSKLTSDYNPVITEGGQGGFRRRVTLSGENNIRDKEINFYDFGGKWIMTVND